MNRPGALPKYIAIAEGLTRDIQAGRFMVGERLPGERDMAESYGVSVGTLRRALGELENRALLRRVQGSGNYVAKHADAKAVYAFFRLELVAGGGLPTARVLDIKYDGVWIIRRVRFLDGLAVALEEIHAHLPADAALDSRDLSEALYLTYREDFGVLVTSVHDQVSVGVWPDWGPKVGSGPCGLVKRNALSRDGTLAEYSTTWYAPDKAVYANRST